MTKEDEKLQKLITRYIEKNGGKKGSLWTLARQCYSVGYQSRRRKDTMINFDIYKGNPAAAAALIERTCECYECPMIRNCDEPHHYNKEGDHDFSLKETQKCFNQTCFNMWKSFFEDNPETLESVNNLVGILRCMTDCEKCEAAKEYGCNSCSIGEPFMKWLSKEVPTCQESQQVEEPDSVNHPDHYMLIDGAEVVDVINEILTRLDFTAIQGFYLGNVLKYILKAYQKNSKEDYKKASVYLNGLIESM